ncbi:hypothetical protein Bbelb_329070 [Branchiostoma belcheri]|nr:hypothetical protein Bbelb_329070 [Branchiostoma belcheri]
MYANTLPTDTRPNYPLQHCLHGAARFRLANAGRARRPKDYPRQKCQRSAVSHDHIPSGCRNFTLLIEPNTYHLLVFNIKHSEFPNQRNYNSGHSRGVKPGHAGPYTAVLTRHVCATRREGDRVSAYRAMTLAHVPGRTQYGSVLDDVPILEGHSLHTHRLNNRWGALRGLCTVRFVTHDRLASRHRKRTDLVTDENQAKTGECKKAAQVYRVSPEVSEL